MKSKIYAEILSEVTPEIEAKVEQKANQILAMKDLTKVFIDLKKCTEEQRKLLPQILEKAGEKIGEKIYIHNTSMVSEYPYFHKPTYANYWTMGTSNSIPEKQELTYPDFIKLFEGGEEVRTELLPDVAYWRHRCLLAEKCLSESPCDPDITNEQIKAHNSYNEFIETFGNKD